MPSLKINPNGSPHTHTYIRRSEYTMKCIHPQCTHFTYMRDLEGKESICSICQTNKIILTKEQLKLNRPRCFECSKSKKARAHKEIKNKLQEIGIL